MRASVAREAIIPFLACVILGGARTAAGQPTPVPARRPTLPPSARLYVFDCGTIQIGDLSRFRLKREEVATPDLSVACFLVAHPKGTLIWDTGAVPDGAWHVTGEPVKYHVILPRPEEYAFGHVTMVKTLAGQLADVGHSPADITYLALSHYHYDHTANANAFAGATWLVRQVEREAMFSSNPPAVTQPSSYSALRASKTIIIEKDDYDVFGDGTVVIKVAPGHTPGHQVLYVRLARSGGILLSGDLYHYSEARTLKRLPTFDFDQGRSEASRSAIEAFLSKTGAQLWIQHDLPSNSRLAKAPLFYE